MNIGKYSISGDPIRTGTCGIIAPGTKHDKGKARYDLMPEQFKKLAGYCSLKQTDNPYSLTFARSIVLTANTPDKIREAFCVTQGCLRNLGIFTGQVERGVAQVLAYGANKYADNNWQKVEPFIPRYKAAAIRHIDSIIFDKEYYDYESGLMHFYHIMANLTFLAWGFENGK